MRVLTEEAEETKNLGVMSFEEAIQLSKSQKMDLSIVNSTISPAVLKLTDYRNELYREFVNKFYDPEQ